jgi:hypothetical protein
MLRLLVPDRGNVADWLDTLAANQAEPSFLSESSTGLTALPETVTLFPKTTATSLPVTHGTLERLATFSVRNWTWPFTEDPGVSPRVYVYPSWLYVRNWGGSAARYLPAYAALATGVTQMYARYYPYTVEHPSQADIFVTVLSNELPETAQQDGIEVARTLYRALSEHLHLKSLCSYCRHVILTEHMAMVVPSTEALFAADVPDTSLYWLVPPFPKAFDPSRRVTRPASERPYTLAVLTPLVPSESIQVASWYTEPDVHSFSSNDPLSVWALADRARFCYTSAHPRWSGRIAVAMSAGCIPVHSTDGQVQLALGMTETSLPVSLEHLPIFLRHFPLQRIETIRQAIEDQFREKLAVESTQMMDDATPAYAQKLALHFYNEIIK